MLWLQPAQCSGDSRVAVGVSYSLPYEAYVRQTKSCGLQNLPSAGHQHTGNKPRQQNTLKSCQTAATATATPFLNDTVQLQYSWHASNVVRNGYKATPARQVLHTHKPTSLLQCPPINTPPSGSSLLRSEKPPRLRSWRTCFAWRRGSGARALGRLQKVTTHSKAYHTAVTNKQTG